MYQRFLADPTDILQVIEKLSESGATSLKMLSEDFRLALLEEAAGYTYQPLREVVGSGENVVRQQMEMFSNFPHESKYILLKYSFQIWLDKHLKQMKHDPFKTPLNLNAFELLRYEAGSLGITAHRDGFRYKNLVCIFIIGGKGRFFVCSDRSGSDSRELDASPGNVILMRAPGFFGQNERPFHYVRDIQETRYVFGLRQDVSQG